MVDRKIFYTCSYQFGFQMFSRYVVRVYACVRALYIKSNAPI